MVLSSILRPLTVRRWDEKKEKNKSNDIYDKKRKETLTIANRFSPTCVKYSLAAPLFVTRITGYGINNYKKWKGRFLWDKRPNVELDIPTLNTCIVDFFFFGT